MKKIMFSVAILVAAGLGYLAWYNPSQAEQSAPAATTPAPEVAVATMQEKEVRLTSELPGRTTAFQVAEIRPQVGGIIQKRAFKEGSEIKKGELLYQIDPSTYEVAVARTTAAVAKAQAELEAARIDLQRTKVVAPIDGRIGRSTITPGALVTANQAQAMATVQQLDPIYVDLTQSNVELLRLRRAMQSGHMQSAGAAGTTVRLILEDGSEYPLPGTLQLAEANVDQDTGTVTLRAVFPNPDRELLPGMYVRARIEEGILARTLLIPQQAVTRNAQGQAQTLVVGGADPQEQRQLGLDRAGGGGGSGGRRGGAGERRPPRHAGTAHAGTGPRRRRRLDRPSRSGRRRPGGSRQSAESPSRHAGAHCPAGNVRRNYGPFFHRPTRLRLGPGHRRHAGRTPGHPHPARGPVPKHRAANHLHQRDLSRRVGQNIGRRRNPGH